MYSRYMVSRVEPVLPLRHGPCATLDDGRLCTWYMFNWCWIFTTAVHDLVDVCKLRSRDPWRTVAAAAGCGVHCIMHGLPQLEA